MRHNTGIPCVLCGKIMFTVGYALSQIGNVCLVGDLLINQLVSGFHQSRNLDLKEIKFEIIWNVFFSRVRNFCRPLGDKIPFLIVFVAGSLTQFCKRLMAAILLKTLIVKWCFQPKFNGWSCKEKIITNKGLAIVRVFEIPQYWKRRATDVGLHYVSDNLCLFTVNFPCVAMDRQKRMNL